MKIIAGFILVFWGLASCASAREWSEGRYDINGWVPDSLYVPTVDPSQEHFWIGQGLLSLIIGAALLFWAYKLNSKNTK